MISHVYSTAVHVTNQDAALDFYVNKLGFEKRSDEPMGPTLRWIEVVPPGAQTVLILATKDFYPTNEMRQLAEAVTGKFSTICFTATDLEATYRELSEKGVPFTTPPTKEYWGYYAQFRDPDGNEFLLVEKK